VVLAFGLALSFAFIGGAAAAHGSVPIPFSKKKPLVFSVGGGIAVFVISLTLGNHLYNPPNQYFTTAIIPLADGVPIKLPGKIKLEYGGNSPTEEINSHGQCRGYNH
jgi:hypothetical protein